MEEAEGVRFLTMELIEGRTLDHFISDRGMDLNRFLDMATPIAEALASAHDRGVIHRDLKPSNVMVTDDRRVKVLDFGLAKLSAPRDEADTDELPTEALTGIGTVVGTMPYMSPEQVEGQAVDHRTDIFSLGVLMYEMATGNRPFAGKSSPGLMSAILRDQPAPVVEKRRDLPNHLGRVIGRCLEKDPRDRYQTARDVFNELRTVRRESGSIPADPSPLPAAGPSGEPLSAPAESGVARQDEGFWVAVVPFTFTGTDTDLAALAEGLTEDIVTGLSRFSYLRVISRSSTRRYASEGVDVRAVGEELGARYVMEGNLRKAGKKLRLAVQLVDTDSGAHLWAEAYDRDLDPEDLFALQDDLVPRVVSTVADIHGVLPRSMSQAVQGRDPEELSPYEAVLRSFVYFERVTPEELAAARSALELAVKRAPAYTEAWAMLALLCAQEYGQGFGLLPDSLATGAAAARRAVATGPSNHLAHFSLAQVLFFQKEFEAFRNAAARAAELNPMDGNSIAFLGELLTYSGDSERGLDLAGRAKRLNPNHPGWYWYADFFQAYRERDYPAALAIAQKVNLPDHWGQHAAIAIARGQLGDREAAGKALKRLLDLRPDFADIARQEFEKWWDSDFVEHLIDGLQKAGLDMTLASGSQQPSASVDASSLPASGEARTDEGFWVAVLPFKFTGSDDDLEALADGLSEDIVTGLSRFSYLRVISRSATSRYADAKSGVRTVGEELGARYVMDGSLRRAGTKLRIAVQLVDTVSGAHLWAQAYDRDFIPDELFALQDDLVPRIVSTCADHFGVLARAISEAVRSRPLDELTSYEALMRGFGYHFRLTPEEHAQARDALEQAVEHAPSNADCWAMLAWVYAHEFAHDFNPRPNSLDRALEAARRAVDIAPASHFAQQVLAVVLFFRKQIAECRSAAERSMELNPLDGSNEAFFIITFSGEWERGCALIRRAMGLNPHHPGWYRAPLGVNEYRKGNYPAAVDEAVKANSPDVFWIHLILAAAHSQLGDLEPARKALGDLLNQKPDFPRSGRELLGKWFQPELVDHLMDGLRKAGLEFESGEVMEGAVLESGSDDDRPGIAVLPFVNRSDDPENEYFSDGLTEELIADLAGINALSVISRTSAMLFKGTDKDLPTIGRELGVRYILEGSVRKAGSSLRITAQLVDAENDTPLWSEKYSGTVDDVFEVQERVSREIVHALDVTLTSDENRRLAERPIADVRAFELYLQARQEIRRFETTALERAEKLLSQAINIEGETPPLVALKALTTVTRIKAGSSHDLSQLNEVEARALALLEESPNLPQAHALLGSIGYESGRLQQAVWHCNRALEGNSNDAEAFLYLSASYMAAGQPEQGLDAGKRMVACDPLASISWMILGAAYWFVDRPEEGLAALERGVELDPQNFLSQWAIGYTYATLGRIEEARRHAEFFNDHWSENPYGRQLVSLVDALEGRQEAALKKLADVDLAPLDAHTKFHLSESYAMAGDTRRALEVLGIAVDQGFYPYPFIHDYCPFMAPLRSLPEFAPILAKSKEKTATFREDGPLRPFSQDVPGGGS